MEQGSWKRFEIKEKKGEKPILKGVIEDYKGKTYVSLWATPTFEDWLRKTFGSE